MTTIETTSVSSYKETFSLRKFVRANGTPLGIFSVFVGLWIIFILAAPDTFTKPLIYYAFMSTIPFFAIIAMPLTILVIAGEMDLSFPSIMAIGMVIFLLTYFQFGAFRHPFAGRHNRHAVFLAWGGVSIIAEQERLPGIHRRHSAAKYPGRQIVRRDPNANGLVSRDRDPVLGFAQPHSLWGSHLLDR
jgi:hypothetical protein